MNPESDLKTMKQLSQSKSGVDYQIFVMGEDQRVKEDLRKSRWDSFYQSNKVTKDKTIEPSQIIAEAKPGETREQKYTTFDRSSIEIIDAIGKSGKYFAGYDKEKKRSLLLKRVKVRDFSSEKDKKVFQNEKKILKLVSKMKDTPFTRLENIFRKRYETHTEYTIVFSKGDCTLEEIFSERKKLKKYHNEKEILTIFKDVLNCLSMLENENISYMNIRADNVIYFNDVFSYSLIDFENSVATAQPAKLTNSKVHETFDMYNSPERSSYKNENFDPYKSDVWSLGVLLLEAIGENVETLRTNQMLVKGKITNLISSNRKKSYPFIAELLEKMLSDNPEARPTLSNLIEEVKGYFKDLDKFDKTFDDDIAAVLRKKRLEAFVKRNSLSEDLKLFVETLRIARNEAKMKKDYETCLIRSEEIYKKITEESDYDKDIIFALEILNLMKYKKLTNTITRDDYNLMYQEKTKIFRLLNKNYEKLAPKLIHMIEVFVTQKVFTVPIEICEMVIDQNPNTSSVCSSIEDKYKAKMNDMKKSLADEIIRKSKKSIRKSIFTIFLILTMLALVAYLMDLSTKPKQICNEKGECFVYREKWLKLEVGPEGEWSLPRVWMNQNAMCGITLYYSPNNKNNPTGPAYVSSIKIHTCHYKNWIKQNQYYLTDVKQDNVVFNRSAKCEPNQYVKGFKMKTSFDSNLKTQFLSGFGILCGSDWKILEGKYIGSWDNGFSTAKDEYLCGARIKSDLKIRNEGEEEESKYLLIDGIQIKICTY